MNGMLIRRWNIISYASVFYPVCNIIIPRLYNIFLGKKTNMDKNLHHFTHYIKYASDLNMYYAIDYQWNPRLSKKDFQNVDEYSCIFHGTLSVKLKWSSKTIIIIIKSYELAIFRERYYYSYSIITKIFTIIRWIRWQCSLNRK